MVVIGGLVRAGIDEALMRVKFAEELDVMAE